VVEGDVMTMTLSEIRCASANLPRHEGSSENISTSGNGELCIDSFNLSNAGGHILSKATPNIDFNSQISAANMSRPYICKTCLSRKYPSRILSRQSSSSSTPKAPAAPTKAKPKTPKTLTNHSRTRLDNLLPTSLSYYWDTPAPSPHQLLHANKIFTPTKHSPVKLFSASKFRTTPLSSIEPEVAFLGRSNVGKSSLLNALMGTKICWTSSKPGRTREMNAFGIGGTKGGESKIVLLDMPGYGKASREEWGVEIMKYLSERRQLRRTFLLIDAVHGVKDIDIQLLEMLRQRAISHQVIVSKVDKVLIPVKSGESHKAMVKKGVTGENVDRLRKLLEELKPIVQPPVIEGQGTQGPGALGEILTCSAETFVKGGTPLGVSAIRWAVLAATGFDGNVEGMKAQVPLGGYEKPPPLYKDVEDVDGKI
jgi:GTP-binding protein